MLPLYRKLFEWLGRSDGLGPKLLRILERTSVQAKRLFACVFLACLLSSILITNYVADAIDPAVVRPLYWFLDSSSGIRRLNSAGLYYIVLNFSLLFITFLGGAAFISISINGMRLSRALLDSATSIDFRTYGKRLSRLVVAYFFGTLLVFFYAINIIFWKESPLGGTANIDIAGAMLTALGIFFVAIPKRFIEHAWAAYTARGRAVPEDEEGEPRALPLPRSWTRSIWVANVLCIGGWFPYFYGIRDYIDPYYWLQRVLGA